MQPGITRHRAGKGFFTRAAGRARVADEATLDRIRKLAIPPAYTDVWICPRADGHIQATGRDAKGRKQYRYHPAFREVRDSTKYEHVTAFAAALPAHPRDGAPSTWPCGACRAKRCWRPSSTCSKRR